MAMRGNILAFDTTFAACSAAVGISLATAQARIVARFDPMTSGHAEALMPMIEATMAEAGITFNELDALAVTVGPGTFTGTRVGIAAARGLALAADLPVCTATSLSIIAAGAVADYQDQLIGASVIDVCVDARRGQVYRQVFAVSDLTPAGIPVIATTEAVIQDLVNAGAERVLVGSGAQEIAAAAAAAGSGCRLGPTELLPHAAHLLRVELEPAAPPRPLYLRPPDAKPQTGKAIPRRDDTTAHTTTNTHKDD